MSQALDLPKGVHVIAQSAMLSALEGMEGEVATVECGIDDPLPMAALADATIVVIEADPASRNSLERIDRLRSEMPAIPVIAGLANVDIATSRQLIRRGVSDIVALPFAIDELVTAIADTAQQFSTEAEIELAPVLAVLKTIGGTGATTLTTHLAAQMAEDLGEGARACVIDLDLQAGDISSYLGCAPRQTLGDLLGAPDRLDEDLLSSVACEGHPLVDVIAAPAEILPIESVDFDELVRILAIARRRYDVVLLDLPASLTNWSLSTIYSADQTIMVGTLSIPSLRHAKRQIDFLTSMGIDRSSIQVVLNRVEKRLFKTISTEDAAEALKHPILATIGDEANLLRNAQDQGVLVDEIQKRSKFAKEIGVLAELLEDRLAEAE